MLQPAELSSDDEDGFSDDNDYYEFKQKLKTNAKQAFQRNQVSDAEQKRKHLKSIFNGIVFGKCEEVIASLNNGLDVDIDLELGWTPLLLSSTIANVLLITELINRGAKVNQTRKDGTTALMLLCNINSEEAIEHSIFSCIKLLIDKGADVNAVDNKRKNAIMFAANNGYFNVVKFLLPLVDREAEDNQKWNALFWAVDGNRIEIVKYLLDQGFPLDKKDLRGNTLADVAHTNGYHEILDLLPKDPFEEFYLQLNTELHFEKHFNNDNTNRPQFFYNICQVLSGTKSEFVMPIMKDQNVTLYDFLSMTDLKLREIGLEYPFQRNRIMSGLYRFHKQPFDPKTTPYVAPDQLYSNLDVAQTVLTCIKQLIAMEAGVSFMINNSKDRLTAKESEDVVILLKKIRVHLSKMKVVCQNLEKKSRQWDLSVKPADEIIKKRANIPWVNVYLGFGVIGVLIMYKFIL